LNVYLCLPEAIANENIVGILGSPDGNKKNDFMSPDGTDLFTAGTTTKKQAHHYCVSNWCVPQGENIFAVPGDTDDACDVPYDEEFEKEVANADPKIKEACKGDIACITDAVAIGGDIDDAIEEGLRTLEDEEEDEEPPTKEEVVPPIDPFLAPPRESDFFDKDEVGSDVQSRQFVNEGKANRGSGSGDPHFMTWTGEKYDYHGECDLVLLDHPTFDNGKGLRVHIRTTRVKYFSFIEKVAVQIGEDILEFDNDVENFLINGKPAETNRKHHKTLLAGFVVRRDAKALSIRLHHEGLHLMNMPKIDLHTRKNGFPAVIVDGGRSDVFRGSMGLLGDWESGKKMARDGQTEIELKDSLDAAEMAAEWQVRDTEPSLFKESRFPQFPTTCTPPTKRAPGRLGAMAG